MERRQVAFLWWDQDSNPGVYWTHSPAASMPDHKLTEPSRNKLKYRTRFPAPMERAFSQLDTTAGLLSHLALTYPHIDTHSTHIHLLFFMLWYRETNLSHKGFEKLCNLWIEITTFASWQLSRTFLPCNRDCPNKDSFKVLLQWNSTSVYTSCTYSTYHLELALGTFICHFISACLVCHTS